MQTSPATNLVFHCSSCHLHKTTESGREKVPGRLEKHDNETLCLRHCSRRWQASTLGDMSDPRWTCELLSFINTKHKATMQRHPCGMPPSRVHESPNPASKHKPKPNMSMILKNRHAYTKQVNKDYEEPDPKSIDQQYQKI